MMSWRRASPEAHPRSRGENTWRLLTAQLSVGSSPLTRGKLAQLAGGELGDRLIPAHAGKTFFSRRCVKSSAAHPRSRGENVLL